MPFLFSFYLYIYDEYNIRKKILNAYQKSSVKTMEILYLTKKFLRIFSCNNHKYFEWLQH